MTCCLIHSAFAFGHFKDVVDLIFEIKAQTSWSFFIVSTDESENQMQS